MQPQATTWHKKMQTLPSFQSKMQKCSSWCWWVWQRANSSSHWMAVEAQVAAAIQSAYNTSTNKHILKNESSQVTICRLQMFSSLTWEGPCLRIVILSVLSVRSWQQFWVFCPCFCYPELKAMLLQVFATCSMSNLLPLDSSAWQSCIYPTARTMSCTRGMGQTDLKSWLPNSNSYGSKLWIVLQLWSYIWPSNLQIILHSDPIGF